MYRANHALALALFIICCTAASGTSLEDVAEKGTVQVLTSAKWDSFLSELTKPLIVLHYAPWCGHCKRLLPDYEIASRRCASAAVFSKVDCTSQSGLCTGVNGFPHMKIHVKEDSAWSIREYDGETTVEALELLCNRLASPKFKTIPDAVSLEKQSAAFAIDSQADAAEMSLFHSAANDLYHVFSFFVADGLVEHATRSSRRNFANASKIFAVKNGMLFHCHMRSCGSKEPLDKWIRGNSMPVMPSISNGNWHRLSRGKYVVVAVTHPTNADSDSSLEWLGEVALEFERAKFDTPAFEVLQFANLNGQEWASFASRFTKHNGINGVEVFITDTANAGSISVPAANVTDAAAISKFLNHVVSGDVTFNVGWMDWFKATANSPSSIAAFITIAVVAMLIFRPTRARLSTEDRIKALRESMLEEQKNK